MLNSKPPGNGGGGVGGTTRSNSRTDNTTNILKPITSSSSSTTTTTNTNSNDFRRHSDVFDANFNIHNMHTRFNPTINNPYISFPPPTTSAPTTQPSTTTFQFANFPNNNNNNTNSIDFNKYSHLSFYQKQQHLLQTNQQQPQQPQQQTRNNFINPVSLYQNQPAQTLTSTTSSNMIRPLTSNHFLPHSSSTGFLGGYVGTTRNVTNSSANNRPVPNTFDLFRQHQQQQQQVNHQEQQILDDGFLSLFGQESTTTIATTANNHNHNRNLSSTSSNRSSDPIRPASDASLDTSNLIDLEAMTDSEQLNMLSTFELFDPLLADRKKQENIEIKKVSSLVINFNFN